MLPHFKMCVTRGNFIAKCETKLQYNRCASWPIFVNPETKTRAYY